LGIGEGLLIKAIAASMGKQVAIIKTELEKVGDLGIIAKVRPHITARTGEATTPRRILGKHRRRSVSQNPSR
jgi:hypothetical protein